MKPTTGEGSQSENQKQVSLTSGNIAIAIFSFLAIGLCVVLAVWQWQRAELADARYTADKAFSKHQLVELPANPKTFQRVRISGTVLKVYFLDNKTNNHQAGRELLVEVAINNEAMVYDRVLVNIGWQARSVGLSPEYTIPEAISLEGVLKIPNAGFQLQDPQLDPSWPQLMQHVDIELLSSFHSKNFYPAVVYSSTPVSNWPVSSSLQVKNKYQMHIGYSVQWMLLALVFAVLFIKTTRREEHEGKQEMAT